MEIIDIVRDHLKCFPEMQAQDIVKLIFQNEFGPAHLIEDSQKSFDCLLSEYRSVQYNPDEKLIEPIGNGLVRVNLCAISDEAFVQKVNEAFVETAKTHKGTEESFLEKLEVCKQAFHIEAFVDDYLEKGIHPLHHSGLYSQLYHPAYRVVSKGYL